MSAISEVNKLFRKTNTRCSRVWQGRRLVDTDVFYF